VGSFAYSPLDQLSNLSIGHTARGDPAARRKGNLVSGRIVPPSPMGDPLRIEAKPEHG
jgi:hypothetical protein